MKVKRLLWILFLVAAAYAGVMFGHAYYQYFMLEMALEDVFNAAAARLATTPGAARIVAMREIEQTVQADLLKRAQELAVVVSPEDIEVADDEGLLSISVRWTRDVPFPGYTHRLAFQLEERRPIPPPQ